MPSGLFGAYPAQDAVTFANVDATICTVLAVDPLTEIDDRPGPPGCLLLGSLVGDDSHMIRAMAILIGSLAVFVASSTPSRAAEFAIRLDSGEQRTVVARLAGTGQDTHALEFPDGRWQLIPSNRILHHQVSDDPKPLSHEELRQQLREEFGEARTLTEIEKPFVIVLIRANGRPLDSQVEKQLQSVLRKAGVFFKGMQQNFLEFMKQARVETTPIKYPLVALIFEADRNFDAYAAATTEGQGLSAANMAAFYDILSNRLVVRFRECASFDTPLHEAVHQQAYNRGILQRMAPVPLWFNEGLATGFEGDGERVRSGPKVVSDRYGRLALRATNLNWIDVVSNDGAFQGDILAAEAYGHAWGLHWLLVTKYRTEYNNLVRHLAAKKPLEVDRPDQRVADVERIVGKTLPELQREFQQELPRAMARRRN